MFESPAQKIIPSLFFISIIGLGTLSGVYTFSGIGLLMDSKVTAIILAAVIQITIATTVISFPFVNGFFPRAVVLIVYIVFLLISSGTAYVYIFNQQSTSGDISDHDIKFISVTSKHISKIDSKLKVELSELKNRTNLAKKSMEEEESFGLKSGKGRGRGPIYFQKEELYNTLNFKYEQFKDYYGEFQNKLIEIRKLIESQSSSQNYASTVSRINELESFVNNSESIDRSDLDNYVVSLKSPVEKAIDPVLKGEFKSISLVSSMIWSTLFDLASFVVGFIWINRNKSKKDPIIDRTVNLLRSLHYGVIRIKNIRKEVSANKVIVHEGKSHGIDVSRLYKFGARLVAVSNAVSKNSSIVDSLDPLKMVVSRLKVLDFSKNIDSHKEVINHKGSVGILNSEISGQPFLEAVVSIMHLEELFIINKEFEAYELNRENEIALDMVIYLLNNPHVMDNSSIKEFYPQLLMQRYETIQDVALTT